MQKVRLGVIGFGSMGTTHCKNVFDGKVPNMEIGAICDISEDRRNAAKETYPDVPVFVHAPLLPDPGSV